MNTFCTDYMTLFTEFFVSCKILVLFFTLLNYSYVPFFLFPFKYQIIFNFDTYILKIILDALKKSRNLKFDGQKVAVVDT